MLLYCSLCANAETAINLCLFGKSAARISSLASDMETIRRGAALSFLSCTGVLALRLALIKLLAIILMITTGKVYSLVNVR